MSHSGSYSVEVRVPIMGWVGATMDLEDRGATFAATITFGGKSQALEGTVEGDRLCASGDLKLPFGINRFDLTCTIACSTLQGEVATNVGTLPIRGNRL